MAFNVQEEVAERALKIMLKVPSLAGDIVVAALKHVLKKLEERQPVGKQRLPTLLHGGAAVRPADMRGDIDLQLLQRMARKHGVGFSVVKHPDHTFCIYFQSNRAEQMKECINSYTQHKFAREQGKESVSKRLERVKEQLAVDKSVGGRKNFRPGVEYGSARWGTKKDIAPYIDRVPDNNILLTQTESMTMEGRPKNPEHARNKNVIVIGGSGSGKTRFFVKPNLMQCQSKDYPVSYCVTDPKRISI